MVETTGAASPLRVRAKGSTNVNTYTTPLKGSRCAVSVGGLSRIGFALRSVGQPRSMRWVAAVAHLATAQRQPRANYTVAEISTERMP